MPRMAILSSVERDEFDAPPVFTMAQQHQYFEPPLLVLHQLKRLKTPTNQIGFLISYGYFRATWKFFPATQFRQTDIQYVARTLGWSQQHYSLASYAPETQSRHRHAIRTLFEFRLWNRQILKQLEHEALSLAQLYWDPRQIFLRLVKWLVAARVQVPCSDTLSRRVAKALTAHRRIMAQQLQPHLTPGMCQHLMTLLAEPAQPQRGAHYHLTQLKRLSQSTKPTKVRLRLHDLEHIRTLYDRIAPLRRSLNLPQAGIIYYATLTINLPPFDLLRRPTADRMLHLLAFVIHHYYRLQDNLVDVVLNVLPATLNSLRREQMEEYYANRETHAMSLTALLTLLETNVLAAFKTIQRIVESGTITSDDKVRRIQRIFATQKTAHRQLSEAMTPLKTRVEDTTKHEMYYAALERRSLRLQARLMPIVKLLHWEGTDQALLTALRHLQACKGTIGPDAPRRFLTPGERQAVSPPDRPFRVSLYKAFLLIHLATGIKGGTIHLEHSYKYRALEGYLLSRPQWQKHRTRYLQQAELEAFANPQTVLHQLEAGLQQHYLTTNTHLRDQKNAFVQQTAESRVVIQTPPQARVKTEALATFFPGRQYVAMAEILSTVNQLTQFLTELTRGSQQLRETRPPIRTFVAGLLGLGCGIGVRKLARISRHVQEAQVEHTVNWYFTPANLRAANDRILRMIDRLPLPTIYQRSPEALQTSSDGQKFEVPAESLNANFSYKYFGNTQGVAVCSFIDERHLLFYSTVISAAERESTYTLDGLLHQVGTPSTMHSTDTHGYSELIFGLMHFLGLAYAPRIKNFQRQRLYTFKRLRQHPQYATFAVKPSGTINTALILEQWDDILRFVASLKLGVASPSTLFRRLNSYSSQHVLYRALKAFGQILKSRFLLRYLDEVELRQQITQQLNKVEHSHSFTRSLSVGNPRGFLSVEKEAQEVEEGCKRLLKNAVTCWNYVYLSKRLLQTADPIHQQLFLEAVRHGSPISWRHINLLGEYDFSDQRLEDSVGILPATWLQEQEAALMDIIR